MRPITKTVFETFDGSVFQTAAEARAYEKINVHLAIVGLTLDQAKAIASREDADRADAVELMGRQIEKAREQLRAIIRSLPAGNETYVRATTALRALDGEGGEKWRAVGNTLSDDWTIINANGGGIVRCLPRALAILIVDEHNRLRSLENAAWEAVRAWDDCKINPFRNPYDAIQSLVAVLDDRRAARAALTTTEAE